MVSELAPAPVVSEPLSRLHARARPNSLSSFSTEGEGAEKTRAATTPCQRSRSRKRRMMRGATDAPAPAPVEAKAEKVPPAAATAQQPPAKRADAELKDAARTETTSKKLLRNRLGGGDYSAVSQVLSLQQNQFEHQVQELHHISQRQWQHVSRTLFPYLDNFRPTASGAASNPTNASPLFASMAGTNPGDAKEKATSSAQPGSLPSQTAWWHDPMKVMGIPHLPSLVHTSLGNEMPQSSSQMESTMIGSHNPSLLSAGGQQGAGGRSFGEEAGAKVVVGQGEERQHTHHQTCSVRGKNDAKEPVPGSKRAADETRGPEGEGRQKRQREGVSDSNVSCPKPKVATPQSGVDILLGLTQNRR